MGLNDTPEQAAYRAEARAWLEQHKAQAPPRSGSYEDTAYIDSPRLATPAGRGRAGRRDLAQGGRRPGAGADRADHRKPGDLTD